MKRLEAWILRVKNFFVRQPLPTISERELESYPPLNEISRTFLHGPSPEAISRMPILNRKNSGPMSKVKMSQMIQPFTHFVVCRYNEILITFDAKGRARERKTGGILANVTYATSLKDARRIKKSILQRDPTANVAIKKIQPSNESKKTRRK